MSTLIIKDGSGITRHFEVTGDGTEQSPFMPVHALTGALTMAPLPEGNNRIGTTGNVPAPAVSTVQINAATNSGPFTFPNVRSLAVIGPTGSARTLTLQVTPDNGTTWVDTPLVLTTGTGANGSKLWTAEDLAPYSAGGAGHANIFRLKLSGADTVTVKIFGN